MAAKKKTKKTAVKKSASKKTSVPAKKPTAKKTQTRMATVAPKSAKGYANLISPLDDRLVVRVRGASETTAGGIIIPGNAASRPNRGEVLAKGPGHRNKKGRLRPLDVQVGDEILFAEFAGTKLTIDNEDLLILRENEVLGIVD